MIHAAEENEDLQFLADDSVDDYGVLLLARRLATKQDPMQTILFFMFGAVIFLLGYCLAQGYRRADVEERLRREEETRREQQKAIDAAHKKRERLVAKFRNKHLAKVLKASNFKNQETQDVERGSFKDKVRTMQGGKEKSSDIGTRSIGDDNEVLDSKPTVPLGGNDALDLTTEVDQILLTREDIQEENHISLSMICPICLEVYTEGDTVILSSNPSCHHGFHDECILDYLVRCDDDEGTCPCCRQIFLLPESANDGGDGEHERKYVRRPLNMDPGHT